MTATLVDTNVFISIYQNNAEPAKRSVASDVIREVLLSGNAVVSTQVLNEFANVILKKSLLLQSPAEVDEMCREIAKLFDVLPLNADTTFLALDGIGRYQLSFWDALIWATAKQHNIPEILTEDVPGFGTVIDGVRYRNPFAA